MYIYYIYNHKYNYMGTVLDNNLQTPPPPSSKRDDDKIFLAYASDDFKTKKNVKEKKNLVNSARLRKYLVEFIASMPLTLTCSD